MGLDIIFYLHITAYPYSDILSGHRHPSTHKAIYFGNAHWHGNTGAGKTGPWVGADLEQGP